MDKKYIELFKNLASSIAITAEQVMDYDHEKKDDHGLETAKFMRDDYQALSESLNNLGKDYELNKKDAAKLLVGAMIIVNQLKDRANNLKNAMDGYQSDIIPKLQKIVDEAKDDIEAMRMANENFIIKDNE